MRNRSEITAPSKPRLESSRHLAHPQVNYGVDAWSAADWGRKDPLPGLRLDQGVSGRPAGLWVTRSVATHWNRPSPYRSHAVVEVSARVLSRYRTADRISVTSRTSHTRSHTTGLLLLRTPAVALWFASSSMASSRQSNSTNARGSWSGFSAAGRNGSSETASTLPRTRSTPHHLGTSWRAALICRGQTTRVTRSNTRLYVSAWEANRVNRSRFDLIS